jgi:GT2 family glycosyltransferase
MKDQPLISIITVNYNQAKVTCELLASIRKLNYKNIETIVVDNCSSEKTAHIIAGQYPEVKVIVSNKNLGFAGGNNLGIKASNGDFLFFVNNDTELTPDIIQNLLNRFKESPEAGVVSPKIRYFAKPEVIQYAGYTPVNPYTARNKTIGHLETDKGQHDMAKETNYAHGAAMMVKREIIHKVGMMPEEFFLYYEELDWCEQIKRTGFKIYFEPKALIFHKESISVGKMSTLKTYYLTRNRILFMRRNARKLQLFIFILFLILFTIPKNTIVYLFKKEKKHLEVFIKAILWNYKDQRKEKPSGSQGSRGLATA